MIEERALLPDEAQFFASYSIGDYDRPSIATDIATFSILREETASYRLAPKHKLCALLIKRSEHPFKDCWALPGGFLLRNETIEACAFRELQEETGIAPQAMIWVNTYSQPGRDPRGWIISHAFASVFCEENAKIVADTDAADAKWFDVSFSKNSDQTYTLELRCEEIRLSAKLKTSLSPTRTVRFSLLENSGFSFDHAVIIAEALETLKREAENLDTVFAFLPEKFTLLTLQRVQETLMGISQLTPNFRRKIASYVEETDEFTEGVGHRPARLFKRKLDQTEET